MSTSHIVLEPSAGEEDSPQKVDRLSAVEWLAPDGLDEWDAFVARHPLGLVYHLSSWRRVLERAFGHIRGRFLVLRETGGGIHAGLPVYIVRSWLLGRRAVSVPFATMCDPLVSNEEQFRLLWPAVREESEQHGCRRIEIRTRHAPADGMAGLLMPTTRYKHHYLPLAEPADVLFRSFDKSTIRQRVEKARRAGVVATLGQEDRDLRALHGFLVATRRRRSLPPMPFAFFRAMHDSLGPDLVEVYLATQDGEAVGGLLVSKFKDLWTAEYSGVADKAMPGIGPLLYWEAIQRAKSSGAANFSFGRTSLDNAGLLDHKRRWATREEDLVDFSCSRSASLPRGVEPVVAGQALWPRGAIRLLTRYAPATVQKLVGDFCYRHLG